MTIDLGWLQANWLFVAAVAGAAYFWLGGKGNPLAGVKLPAITVKLTDEQLEALKPKG